MIGIYCRISKKKEAGRDVSIEVQKRHGIKFAKSLGIKYQLYIDEGISGTEEKLNDRPAFALLLDAINNKVINIVYCYDQSRIERSSRIWDMFLSITIENKCKYYPNGVFLDLDVPENAFYTKMMSIANELFATVTGIKVKETIYTNAIKGKTHGLTAYGYLKGKDGKFEINEEQAEVIKRIYKMSLDGIGTYTIANILNKEKIPTRFNQYEGQIKRKDSYTNQITLFNKKDIVWRGNVVHDMIRNPIYKGQRRWGDELVSVPQIVSEEYWQDVNDNLQKNKKNAGKREEYHYLLNGLVYCEECGSEFRGKKRLKGKDSAYKCIGKSRSNITCKSRGISISKLETFIIHHLFISKDLQKYLSNLSTSNVDTDNLKNKLTTLKKKLKKLIRVEQTAYDHLLDPDFQNDEVIKEKLKSTKKEIKDNKQTIEILENQLIERDENSRIKRINNTMNTYQLDASFDDTKRLVHSLIKKITIKHNYNLNSKGGNFLILVEYRGFDESSMFMTTWQANKWYLTGYKRSKAITKEDLEEDIDLYEFLIEQSGKKAKVPENFEGFEASSSSANQSIIELKKDELINFD